MISYFIAVFPINRVPLQMWSRRHLKMVRMMLTKQTDATAGPPDGDTFLVGLFETFAYSSLLLVGCASLFLM